MNARVALLCVATTLSAGCSDVVTERHATGAHARQNGAYDRGILPAFVPLTATDIKAAHNTDTEQTWLRFNVSASDWAAMSRSITVTGWQHVHSGAASPPLGFGQWHPVVGQRLKYTPEASSTYFSISDRIEWRGVFVPKSGRCFMYGVRSTKHQGPSAA